MKVYLAGGKSDWRKPLIEKWKTEFDVTAIDPFMSSRQGAIYEFTSDDLKAIGECDLVFGYCDYHIYPGMALEFGFAYGLGIEIIFVTDQPRIDSMMVGVSKAAFTDLPTAVQFVEERYFSTP